MTKPKRIRKGVSKMKMTKAEKIIVWLVSIVAFVGVGWTVFRVGNCVQEATDRDKQEYWLLHNADYVIYRLNEEYPEVKVANYRVDETDKTLIIVCEDGEIVVFKIVRSDGISYWELEKGE